MAIYEPEGNWWKPIHKDEKIWFILALIWMLVSFFYMPIQHFIGKQNPPTTTYRVNAEDFEGLVEDVDLEVQKINAQPRFGGFF